MLQSEAPLRDQTREENTRTGPISHLFCDGEFIRVFENVPLPRRHVAASTKSVYCLSDETD